MNPRRAALEAAETVLCSACLLGFRCRWDGTDKRTSAVERALAGKAVVPICPEVAGGLPIPRSPAELEASPGDPTPGRTRLFDAEGRDVTDAFRRGADEACEAARRFGAQAALLKEGSPSCGTHRVKRRGLPAPGMGVSAAALDRAGVAVVSDEDLADEAPPGRRESDCP